jgi:hypothetical protein
MTRVLAKKEGIIVRATRDALNARGFNAELSD